MQKRILMIVNLLLLAVCGWCIYSLSTTRYEQPKEIAMATGINNGTNYNPTVTPATNETNQVYVSLNKPFMNPLFTPTPTPTPSPTPTPQPPNLGQAVQTWQITILDAKRVDIHDTKTNTDFSIDLGGTHPASDMRGLSLDVKLDSVDLNNLKATFSSLNQHATKDFQ